MKIKPFYNNGCLYFIICFLMFTLTTMYPDNVLIDTPHLVLKYMSPTTIISLIGIGLIFIRAIFGVMYIDNVTIFLIMRIILSLVPIFYINDVPDFFGNIETTILCVISYYIAYNFVDDPKKIKIEMMSLFLIIVIQVILESYLGPISFFDDAYYYKNNLILPIGGSNAIAAIIIPCFSYLLCTLESKTNKVIVFILALFSVILTKSRSGIIALIIMFFMVEILKKNIDIKKIFKFLIIITLSSIIFILLFKNSDTLISVFSKTNNTVLERFERWSTSFELFIEHPIFGVSYLVQRADINPHNWIMNILASNGLMGIILAFLLFLSTYNKLKGNMDDNIIIGALCFVLAILLQGLGEITLFTSRTDFFFWFMVGIAMKEVSIQKNNRNIDYE